MKLLSFATDKGPKVGVAVDEGIVDLARLLHDAPQAKADVSSMLAIIESGVDIDTVASAPLDAMRAAGRLTDYVVADPQFLPPIARPPKILALALNYQEHIDESNLAFYQEPIIFTKYSCNLIGHEATVELPPFPQMVDEEHELALIVGRNCRHIRPSEAADYIFGYTICNDVSARDRQRERLKMGQPYAYAKNFASFCPMGPWIVTAKELPDARGLAMKVRVNGEVRREGNSRDMIFDPYTVLAYCSDYTLMEAGDIISLGTYAGHKRLAAGDTVELEMEAGDIISLGTYAGHKRLAAGDTVELEIEKIGTLRNKVAASSTPWRSFAADTPTGPLVRDAR